MCFGNNYTTQPASLGHAFLHSCCVLVSACRGRCWHVSSFCRTAPTSTTATWEDEELCTLLPPLDTPGTSLQGSFISDDHYFLLVDSGFVLVDCWFWLADYWFLLIKLLITDFYHWTSDFLLINDFYLWTADFKLLNKSTTDFDWSTVDFD